MKYIFSLTIAAFWASIFFVPGFVTAQITNNPYQNEPYPQQEQPQANEPEPQVQPPEPVTPQEKPLLYQENAPVPTASTPKAETQVTSSETPPSTQVTDSESAVQSVSSFPISYILYAVLAGVLAYFFWLGWREWLKRNRKTDLPAEDDGTVCKTCGGKGTVTKKIIKTVPCGHCKGTGQDICHHCGGSGRYGVGLTVPQTQEEVESLMKCDYCGGTGVPKIPVACCMCKGKRKESYEESYEAPCPTCKGTGRVAR